MPRLRVAAICCVISLALPLKAASSLGQTGFLAPGEFDVIPALEPAPMPSDPRFTTDRRIFRATRSLRGTPRWAFAVSDADETVPAMMRNFSCATGVKLTPQNAPKLAALVVKAGNDTRQQSARAKAFFRRSRPFLYDRGPVCQSTTELLEPSQGRMSYDYPSGHTTWGWTWALILAAVVPDRATEIFGRGRAYGDSRFICGAHNESAVEAGMQSASATMAVVSAKPEYQAALAEARHEFAQLRANPSASATECSNERALIDQRVMPKLRR